jgi:hypothetical protein
MKKGLFLLLLPLALLSAGCNSSDSKSSYNNEDECDIKGNLNASGERIYHMPSDEFYEVTKIDSGKGEKWFCSESEAEDAGWRRAKR